MSDGVAVAVFVGVLVGVSVGVLVAVFVGVLVGVFVGVIVGVFVGVGVGVWTVTVAVFEVTPPAVAEAVFVTNPAVISPLVTLWVAVQVTVSPDSR